MVETMKWRERRFNGPGAIFLKALFVVLISVAPPFGMHAAPPEVRLQMILVRSVDEAAQILDTLREGGDFSQIAHDRSIDPTSSDRGILGSVSPDSLRIELRTAVAALAPGQFTSVISIPAGFAIVRRMPDEPTPPKGSPATPSFTVASNGGVKYVVDVDGFSEADTSLTSMRKDPDWNRDSPTVCEMRKASLSVVEETLEGRIADWNAGRAAQPEALENLQTHYALGQLYAYEGRMILSVAHFESAYKAALAGVPNLQAQLEEVVGVAYLHEAEMENGAFTSPGTLDLFPMGPESAFRETANSKKAVEYFLKYLKRKPEELEVRWLLNIAYMTLGQYPRGVPAQFLIAPSAFESKENVGRFIDVAPETGLNMVSSAGGVIAEDFANNGLLDIVTSGVESCGPMHYFRNNGDGTFTDRTESAGLGGQLAVLNLIQADYNNDGCMDILALRGGWEFPQRKSLLRNNCDGTFTDVTDASGLGAELTSTQTAVWVDIDNDGLVDLFVGNESGPAQLFHNEGNGKFRDIAVAAGVAGNGAPYTKSVTAGDFDGDGYMDLYISNFNGPNMLYHNNGNSTFTNVTVQAGVPGTGRSFAAWFFDYDNDGRPDIFVTSYFVSVEETVRTYLRLPHNAPTMKLYRNLGDGTFRDVTVETGLDKVFMPMGSNFGDVDNDGWLDIYLGTGNPSYAALIPAVLLRNHDGKFFTDITTSSGTGQLHKGHGVAFADLGNNGNEDLIAVVGGAVPGDSHAFRVFRNPGHNNDWITLKLTGVKTNRAALGARIAVTVQNPDGSTRSIYRTVGSGGSFGASPLQQHIGLGRISKILTVEVTWPVSKTHQVFQSVPKDRFIGVRELDTTYSKLERKSFRLPGPIPVAAGTLTK
jgi:hypothetical protein